MLNNKPLLDYTVKASLDSVIDRTIVSTDDKQIAKVAIDCGAEVVQRPQILANDTAQIEPSIEYTLNYLEKKEGYYPDLVVLLQNTSPLRNANHINGAMNVFKKGKYDSVLSGFLSHYFLWKIQNNISKPINYNPLKRPNRQQMTRQFIENGAIYITKYSLFKKTKCRISGKIGLYEMPEEQSIQIDSKFDLLFAKQVIKEIEMHK